MKLTQILGKRGRFEIGSTVIREKQFLDRRGQNQVI